MIIMKAVMVCSMGRGGNGRRGIISRLDELTGILVILLLFTCLLEKMVSIGNVSCEFDGDVGGHKRELLFHEITGVERELSSG